MLLSTEDNFLHQHKSNVSKTPVINKSGSSTAGAWTRHKLCDIWYEVKHGQIRVLVMSSVKHFCVKQRWRFQLLPPSLTHHRCCCCCCCCCYTTAPRSLSWGKPCCTWSSFLLAPQWILALASSFSRLRSRSCRDSADLQVEASTGSSVWSWRKRAELSRTRCCCCSLGRRCHSQRCCPSQELHLLWPSCWRRVYLKYTSKQQ